MAEIKSLSVTDASNTARFPENMAPSAVNNGARALEGMVARRTKDTDGSLASTGSSNAYALAINQGDFAATSGFDGYMLAFQANHGNTGAATLNVTPSGGSAVGNKAIKKHNDQDLASGDIETGQVVLVCYDNSSDTFQMLSAAAPVFTAIASQAEAEAGTNNTKGMTPLRTSQAVAALTTNANLLINGDMRIAQRGTSFAGGTDNADDTYTLDRWYNLAEGSDSVDITRTADSPDDNGYCYRMDVETTGEKFGLAQIIEANNCIGAIGNTVTLSFYAKVSNARIDTVKAGIIAWSGTADTVTSDLISSWNVDGTTPTLIANATFENTPADLSVTTDWARYTISAAVDTASAKNIAVFIWSDDATNPLAGDFLYITNVKLEVAASATAFVHEEETVSLNKCQRYYFRLGEQDSASAVSLGMGKNSSTTASICMVQLPVTMRVNPSLIVSSVSHFQISETSTIATTDLTAVTTNAKANTVQLNATVASGLTAGRGVILQLATNPSTISFSAEL